MKTSAKINEIERELRKTASKKNQALVQRFFKTGENSYASHDTFIGVSNPRVREVVKKYKDISYTDIAYFVKSPIHEFRLFGLLVLVARYKKDKEKVYKFYLRNIKYVNNWDLVDVSTPHVIGEYILENKKERKNIEKMCRSKDLWERRISILACWPQIKQKDFDMFFRIAERLMGYSHDLIHKALGWMLREVYKKDPMQCKGFIKKYYVQIPRTTLRYAIEKMPEKERQHYLLMWQEHY